MDCSGKGSGRNFPNVGDTRLVLMAYSATSSQTPPHMGATAVPDITPIFVSVKEAARALSLTTWSVYRLLDEGAIDSRYHGRRRLVSVASLNEYAASLPTEPVAADAS